MAGDRYVPKSVGVVIPNYKGGKYIKDCVLSVLRQNPEALYFIDNNEDDSDVITLYDTLVTNGYSLKKEGSWKVYVKKGCTRVEVKENGYNTGFCHAVNQGIVRCREKYVFLLNNDTVLERKCINILADFLERNGKAFSVGAKMLSLSDRETVDGCGDSFNIFGFARSIGKGRKSSAYNTEKRVFSVSGGASMYRRSLFGKTKVGLFDETHFAYLEDVDIGFRANAMGYRNYFEPDAVVYHAGSAASGSIYNDFKQYHSARNTLFTIYKNEPLPFLLINLPFIIVGFAVKLVYFTFKGLGNAYAAGIKDGLRLALKRKQRIKKVHLNLTNLPRFIHIEAMLIANTLH